MKSSWIGIGCSHHSVPSLSNTATRSSTGTGAEPSRPQTRSTNSMIARRAGPSRQLASVGRRRGGGHRRTVRARRRRRPHPNRMMSCARRSARLRGSAPPQGRIAMSVEQHTESPASAPNGAAALLEAASRYGNAFLLSDAPDHRLPADRHAGRRRDAAARRGARARRDPDAQPRDLRDHVDGARGAAGDRRQPASQLHRPRRVSADGGDRAALHPDARGPVPRARGRRPARARRARRRRSCSARCR